MELKTPISALQEHMVAIKKIPRYELVHNGVGTHNPKFIYRVYANDSWVEAEGKSKKEAKHKAAAKMLETLNLESVQIQNTPLAEQFTLDEDMDQKENYVGDLKEYCLTLPYPEPSYTVEEETGPAHCKIFKMVCFVSQLSEFGVATTKKAAKQIAAYKMLKRLKNLSDSQNTSCEVSSEKPLNPSQSSDQILSRQIKKEEIIKKYCSLKPDVLLPKKERFVYYKDHERAYVGLPEQSETLDKIIKQPYLVTNENALEFLKTIASDLESGLTTTTSDSDLNETCTIVTLSGNSDWPGIAGIGENVENASFNLLLSLFILCSTHCP